MTNIDKFYFICKTYKVFVDKINTEFLDEILLKEVMLKAAAKHPEISFESFVHNCCNSPLKYLYNVATNEASQYHQIHLLNNCFNDGSDKHFGFKLNNDWFIITHSKNNFSLSLFQNEFYMKPKDLIGTSYLTSYKNCSPNILKYNVGSIRKNIIEEYKMKFLKR